MLRVNRNHFTLIELLVVIAIIAVLSTLLFPVLSGLRGKAGGAACKSLLKSYAYATELYTQAWDGYLPDIQTYLLPDSGFVDAFGSKTFAREVVRCPGDQSTVGLNRMGQCRQGGGDLLQVSIGGSGNTLSNSKSGRRTGFVVDFVKKGDPRMKRPSGSINWTDYQATDQAEITGAFYPASPPKPSSGTLGNVAFRHGNALNGAFLDGHVGTVRMKKSISLKNDGHDLEDGETWAAPANTQYPFGPRPANAAMGATENPSVTYD